MKTAFITGGTKRIGSHIAKHLRLQGWEVIVHTSSQIIKNLAYSQTLISADFRFSGQVSDMLDKLPELDLVINNAAIFDPNIEESEVMQVNCYAPLQIIEYFAKHTKKPICIINMLDAWVKDTETVKFKAYKKSKLSLEDYTIGSVQNLPSIIRVVGIEIGLTLYKEGQSKERFAELQRKFPTSLDDIYQVIDYIVENEAIRGNIISISKNGNWRIK